MPDYPALVRFLLSPFLENPGGLRIDCESSVGRSRVLIRVAFDAHDKNRVSGRNGRNIQAILTVLQAVAQTVGQVVHLDIYMPPPEDTNIPSGTSKVDGSEDSQPRQSNPEKPLLRKRS